MTTPDREDRRSDTPLPKGLKALPPDVTKEVWRLWPRKVEAHLIWGVRMQQITQACTRGKIPVYMCPDQSIRLPTDALRQFFGPPKTEDAADEQAAAGKVQSIDVDDPIVGMFREVVGMLRDLRQEKLDILKMLLDPLNLAMGQLEKQHSRMSQRIEQLEGRADSTMNEREALIDNRHLRDLATTIEMGKEKRRDDLAQQFRGALPSLVKKFTGVQLSDFVAGFDPQELELLISSGFLKAEQVGVLRDILAQQSRAKQAATAAAAKANAPAPPGASSNGQAPIDRGVNQP